MQTDASSDLCANGILMSTTCQQVPRSAKCVLSCMNVLVLEVCMWHYLSDLTVHSLLRSKRKYSSCPVAHLALLIRFRFCFQLRNTSLDWENIRRGKLTNADDRRTRNLYEKLVRVNLREKLVRVSYRLAARFNSCEFLASNKTCSIWSEKLAITWLNLRHWLDTQGGCKSLASVDASFSYVCLRHYA